MTVNLICSHNNRIQCLLADLEETSHTIDEKYKLEPPITFQPTMVDGVKLRFKNCAILQFVGKGYTLTVSMIYEGELGDGDGPNRTSGVKKYYCLTEKNGPDTQFKHRTYRTFVNYDGVNVLVGRHGEAEHNGHYFYDRPVWYDTNLTKSTNEVKNDGYTQAAKVAVALADLYPELKTLKLLPSDLKRTYQTLQRIAIVLSKAFEKKKSVALNVEWYLLPCSHEVSSEKSNCDKKESKISTKVKKALTFENTPLYSNLQATIQESNMNTRKYLEFYPSGFRKGINFGRKKCRNTNMLEIARDILYPKNDTISENKNDTISENKNEADEAEWIGDDNPDKMLKSWNNAAIYEKEYRDRADKDRADKDRFDAIYEKEYKDRTEKDRADKDTRRIKRHPQQFGREQDNESMAHFADIYTQDIQNEMLNKPLNTIGTNTTPPPPTTPRISSGGTKKRTRRRKTKKRR